MMLVKSCRASLIKYCQDLITYFINNNVSTNLEFINLDAHALIDELKPIDYLTMGGFALSEDDKTLEIVAQIGVMTYNDPNLFRHYEMLDYIFETLRPENKLRIFNADTASEIGWAVITNDTTLFPVNRAEHRTHQIVNFSALLGLS